MQRGLKYIKLFEDQSSSLKSEFLNEFPETLTRTYWQMPEVAFAVWKHLAHDTGNVGKLMRLGLFDKDNLTTELVNQLPNIDRIVCIYGHRFTDTEEQANLLNRMCDSIVTGIQRTNGYDIFLDEDHLTNREYLETVSLSPGGNNRLTSCETFSGVPLIIVERMSNRKIFLNVDDLDKIKPY